MLFSAKSTRRTILILSLLLAPLTPISLATGTAWAQARGATQRVIEGRVETKDGAGIHGAIVYLKDDHTSSVRSAISADDGSYRFGQLSLSTDYEIWAASDGKKSPTKTISSFDSKPQFTIILKIDK
jgi:hypothetical protein